MASFSLWKNYVFGNGELGGVRSKSNDLKYAFFFKKKTILAIVWFWTFFNVKMWTKSKESNIAKTINLSEMVSKKILTLDE